MSLGRDALVESGMARRRASFWDAFTLSDKRWEGSENDVSGSAWAFVVVQAVWWRIVGVPVAQKLEDE
jgi:hypothetical protein